mmetsp:Transcript_30622/g.76019  ORF Transcript_30622/g.76019 Transcript_30622/m.76019 type:complete len:324 (-) Transcript_30622:49-1020(-)
MTPESVSECLDESGSLPGPRTLDSLACSCPDSQDVHAIDLIAGHAKRRSLLVDLRHRCRAVVSHTDGPVVVFDDKYDGQSRQGGHVHCFVEDAVVTGTVAEKADDYLVGRLVEHLLPPVRDAEGRPEGNGDVLRDEGKAAHDAPLLGEHVHGPAPALGAARLLAVQLRHDLPRRDALTQSVHVVAISRRDDVVLAEALDDACTDGLLPVVEMHEARHPAAVVHLGAHVLELPPETHILVEHLSNLSIHIRPHAAKIIALRQISGRWRGLCGARGDVLQRRDGHGRGEAGRRGTGAAGVQEGGTREECMEAVGVKDAQQGQQRR